MFSKLGLTGLLQGAFFGVALDKGDVAEPKVIRDQLKFKQMTMLKMFLSAVASGTLVVAAMKYMGLYRSVEIDRVEVVAQLLGAPLLGAGMYVAGACPGTVFAQLGGGVQSAPYILAGGFSASALYALLYPWLLRTPIFTKGVFETLTLPELTGIPHWILALSMSGMVAGLLYGVEQFYPTPKAKPEGAARSISTLHRITTWSPYLSGLIVGLLEIPSIFFVNAMLGTSTAYTTLLGEGLALVWPSVKSNAFIAKSTGHPWHYWQIALNTGIVLGSFASAYLSGKRHHNQQPSLALSPYGKLTSFLGGLLLLFGARLAGGCPSGHGISGMSQLALSAFVVVPAMFAGGMLAAWLWPDLDKSAYVAQHKVEEKRE
ncbi:putative Membrane protein [Balamuthia mandrillaris]